MASLWKHPDSKFFVGCFTVHSSLGREQWKRSLKTQDRKLARKVADALEEAGTGLTNNREISEKEINTFLEKIADTKSRAATAKIFADVFRTVTGREMGAGSLRAFAASWLEMIRGEIAAPSFLRYAQVTRDFLAFVGAAADRDIMSFSLRDELLLLGFRDELAKRVSPVTTNVSLKVVKQMFRAASERFKIENPARDVKGLKVRKAERSSRRQFTLPELGRIVREVHGSEWEGIVLFGIYSGQRLADIAALRWENVDLMRGELSLLTSKTNRRILLPLAAPLADYLAQLPASDDPRAFIFPKAAALMARTRGGQTVTLSRQFSEVLMRAGLVRRQTHEKAANGKGRDARRKVNEISFHSFRHGVVSMMKAAGVPQSVVQDIVGHESAAISANYTHVDHEQKEKAMATLPSLAAMLRSAERAERAGAKRKQARRK